MNNKKNIALILYHLAYTGVIATIILKLLFTDKSGMSSSLANLVILTGTFVSGIVGNLVISKYPKHKLGVITNGVSFATIVLFYGFLYSSNLWLVYLLVFFLAGIQAVAVANMNATIPLLFEKKYISTIFSQIQVWLQTISLVVPIILNLFVGVINIDVIATLFFAIYLLAIIPWLQLDSSHFTSQPEQKMSNLELILDGYKFILRDSYLLRLNLYRIFNNCTYAILATALPLIIVKLTTSDQVIKDYNTITDFCIGFSFIIIGLVYGKNLINKPQVFSLVARSVSLYGILGFVLLLLNQNYLGMILFGCCSGLGLYFGRISSISIGQLITPQEKLAVTILSGDTITKVVVLATNSLFLWLVNQVGLEKLYLVIAGFLTLSLPSIFVVAKPLQKYHAEKATITT